MFDLDAMCSWDEALRDLEHHDSKPEQAELQEAPAKEKAPLRELEDA